MHRLPKQPGYRLHAPGSPQAGAPPTSTGLSPTSKSTEGTAVGTIVGINEDGVFGVSRADWCPDFPDACHEPFIPLLWVKVDELLGRVPAGSTARFIQDGTLPDDAQGGVTVYRLAG